MRPTLAVRPVVVLILAVLGSIAPEVRAEDGPAESKGPHLTFEKTEHDFGRAGQEQELEAEFSYRNDGTEEITGIRAIGDCGCYGVTLSKESLKPGEHGTLKVRFRTLMFSGPVTKRIRVLAGNGAKQPTTLLLKLDVVAGVVLKPGRIWFGDVLLGSTPAETVYVKWHEEAGTPFEVTAVEVPGSDFDVKTETFEKGPWKGTAVTLAFKKAPPLGIFSATALLRTDHPDYPRISLPITANVTGEVWVQSRTVYFGWIPKGKSKKTSILVKPFSKDGNLGKVTAKSRKGQVAVTVEPHPMRTDRWFRVLVEVPADRDVGKLDDVVEIHTEVPGEEITEIQVRGEVLIIGR